MRELWGTNEVLPEVSVKCKVPKQVADEILNPQSKTQVARAMRKQKKNKAPGEYLIPNEIWKLLEGEGLDDLVQVLEECRKTNTFPKGWGITEVRWLYKKDDPTNIKNYRPIALTDTLYKIFMRIMTERVDEIVERHGLISDDQHGFRRDRSCHSAIMTLKYIMARSRAERKPLHVAYLDISKAYDTVNHEQLWKICESHGIEGKWLENLKRLYQDTTLRAITAQGLTEGIEMKRGIRQGCPLSPVLFALYIEPIAQKLEQTLKEEGMFKPGKPNMLFYADDMVLWAETKTELTMKLTTVVDMMEKLGLQISIDKTEIQCNTQAAMENEDICIETGKGRQ